MAPDLTGSVFGKLTVMSREENDASGSARWKCRCDCGQERVVAGTGLRAGRNKSCGCASPRFTSERSLEHGMCGSRVYKIWAGMLARCVDTKSPKAHLYAEKGITVCEAWKAFENFYADMGDAPAGKSIDRRDGNRGYEPGNCRWATSKEQANNTAANRLVEFNGETKTVSLWADETGMKANTLLYRIRRGWSAEKALTTAPQPRSAR